MSLNKHMEMFKLLSREGDGLLSTISVDVPGYPFGSLTPYCLDRDFIPNILISGLAQHTRNIQTDSRVSLLVAERSSKTNKQAHGRLTWVGDAVRVEDAEDIKARYLRYFPDAQDYFKTHDFSFYKILPKRVRFIGGFGKIFWVEQEDLNKRQLFTAEMEEGIVQHMNQDHRHNLVEYARHFLQLECTQEEI